MNRTWLLLACALVMVFGAAAAEQFDGDTVFINDSRAYISASPHTIQGSSWVTLEVESKLANVDANMVFCFNGEYLQPRKPLQVWNPHNETTEETVFHPNGSITLENVTRVVDWSDYNAEYVKFSVNYGGKDTCYAIEGIPFNAGQRRKARFRIDAPLIPHGKTRAEVYPDYDGKYDIAFYPTSYGLSLAGVQNAINDDKFYLLDPTVDLVNELVFWYDFNGDTTDESSNGNSIGLFGTASVNANNSLWIPAESSSNYAENTSLTGLTGTGDHTMCFRDRRRSDDGNGVTAVVTVGDSDGTNDANFFYYLGNTATWNAGSRDYRYSSVLKNTTTNWCFIWWEGNDSVQAYQDGVDLGACTGGSCSATTIDIDNPRVRLGGWPQTSTYNYMGEIFYVGFWNRGLNVDEIAAINNEGADVNWSDLNYPSASTVNITPDTAYTNSTLTGDYTYTDPNSDTENGTTYRWFRNGTLITGANETTLTQEYFNKSHQIIFEVTPSDGTFNGTSVNSTALTISNTAPEFTAPVYAATVDSNISANWTVTVTDVDPSDVFNITAQLYVNGTNVHNQTYVNVANGTTLNATLDRGNFSYLATLKVNYTAFDGEDNATHAVASQIIVDLPDINSFALNPSSVVVSTESTNITMNCTSLNRTITNATVRISSNSFGPTLFQMANLAGDLWSKVFTPNVQEVHTIEGFCYDNSLNVTTSSANLSLTVTAGGGGDGGGSSGGGGGGLTIVSQGDGTIVVVPASQEVRQPFCPAGKTAPDIPVTIQNPLSTDTTYTINLDGIVCSSVNPVEVGGDEQFSFLVSNCACPAEPGDVIEGFITITDERDGALTKIPVSLVGTRIGGNTLILLLFGFVLLIVAGIGIVIVMQKG